MPNAHNEALTASLLAWFAKNARDLPWRQSYTPYAVWISEVMLQQTQMQRGVAYFLQWMERFPSVFALAEASEEAVLKAWEGLGYYGRARNILRCAKILVERYEGRFPKSREALRALPGIGDYTSAAISGIAFNEPCVCVDANVERVLSRVFDLSISVSTKDGKHQIESLATQLLPKDNARVFNQALMELGELVCTKNPNCIACPLCFGCEAHKNGTYSERPVKNRTQRLKSMDVVCGIVLWQDTIVLFRRPNKGIWAGLTSLPSTTFAMDVGAKTSFERELTKICGEAYSALGWEHTIKHSYTSWNITLTCLSYRLSAKPLLPPDYFLLPVNDLAHTALPSPHRKLVTCFENEGMGLLYSESRG